MLSAATWLARWVRAAYNSHISATRQLKASSYSVGFEKAPASSPCAAGAEAGDCGRCDGDEVF